VDRISLEKMSKSISKSMYVQGMRCPRLLWFLTHGPKKEMPPSILSRMRQGYIIGRLSRVWHEQQHGPATFIEDINFDAALAKTQAAIDAGALVLHEGAFVSPDGMRVRVDLMERTSVGKPWSIHEVKSTTAFDPRDHYLHDVSVQSYVVSTAHEVASTSLVCVNTKYVGPVTPQRLEGFFRSEDVTQEIKPHLTNVSKNIKRLMSNEVLARSEAPRIDIGQHCLSPYVCPYQDQCFPWSLPKERAMNDVFSIPRMRMEDKMMLWKKGLTRVAEVANEKGLKLSALQKRYVAACLSDKPLVDPAGIRTSLARATFPRYFLDFETVSFPVVPWPVRPYSQVPFQVSLHLQDSPESPLQHSGYLHLHPDRDPLSDPRPGVVDFLLQKIPTGRVPTGSVVCFHSPFERSVLKSLADAQEDPTKRDHLLRIAANMWDLEDVFKGPYNDKRLQGSTSIKRVQPILVPERAYADLGPIQDGESANGAYIAWLNGELSREQTVEVRTALNKYCELDTEIMALIMVALKRICDEEGLSASASKGVCNKTR